MAKIKITQKQYDLLLNESKKTVSSVKSVKITKEQYNRLFKSGNLNENNQNIKLIIEGSEGFENELKKEVTELIRYMYRESKELSEYWEANGLSYDDICDNLLKKGLIVKKSDKYKLSRTSGNAQGASKAILAELTEMLNGIDSEEETEPETPLDEEGGYPSGAQDAPTAPYNQPDGDVTVQNTSNEHKLTIIGSNSEIAILEGPDQSQYAFYFGDADLEKFKQYASVTRNFDGNDEDGNPEYNYDDDFDIDEDVLSHFINDNLNSLTIGEGLAGWNEEKDLVKLDDELKQELYDVYDKDQNISSILRPNLEEEEGPANGVSRVKWADDYKEIEPKRRTDKENSAILDKLAYLYDRERQSNPPTKSQHPLPETTVAGGAGDGGSSGPFVGVADFGEQESIIKRDIPVVGETTTVASVGGQYDTPGLANIGRNGEFKKGPKTQAQSKTQYSGGGFVETNDCTKLNNNKVAQNGGCSQGAVDNVVSVKKSKGSVISPSLGENKIYEAIAKKTGKTIEEVKKIIDSKK